MKRETAYAKINLALHVRERLPDGYHRIETIFAFCEEGDVLSAEPVSRSMLRQSPNADGRVSPGSRAHEPKPAINAMTRVTP